MSDPSSNSNSPSLGSGSGGGDNKADLFRAAIGKMADDENEQRAARQLQYQQYQQAQQQNQQQQNQQQQGQGQGQQGGQQQYFRAGRGGGGGGGGGGSGFGERFQKPSRTRSSKQQSFREKVYAAKRISPTCLVVDDDTAPHCVCLLRYSGPRPQASGTMTLRSLHLVACHDFEPEDPSEAEEEEHERQRRLQQQALAKPGESPSKTTGGSRHSISPQVAMQELARNLGALLTICEESSAEAGTSLEKLSFQLGTVLISSSTSTLQFPQTAPFVRASDVMYEVETGQLRPFFVRDSPSALRSAMRKAVFARKMVSLDAGTQIIVQLAHPETGVSDTFTFLVKWKNQENLNKKQQQSPTEANAEEDASNQEESNSASQDRKPFEIVPLKVSREGFHVQWLLHYIPHHSHFTSSSSENNHNNNAITHALDGAVQAEFSGLSLSVQHPNVKKVAAVAERLVIRELQHQQTQLRCQNGELLSTSWLSRPYDSSRGAAAAAAAATTADSNNPAANTNSSTTEDQILSGGAVHSISSNPTSAAATPTASATATFVSAAAGGGEQAATTSAVKQQQQQQQQHSAHLKPVKDEDDFGFSELPIISQEDIFPRRGMVDDNLIIVRAYVKRREFFTHAKNEQSVSPWEISFTRAVHYELASSTAEPSPFTGIKNRVIRVNEPCVRSELRQCGLEFTPIDFNTNDQNAAMFTHEVLSIADDVAVNMNRICVGANEKLIQLNNEKQQEKSNYQKEQGGGGSSCSAEMTGSFPSASSSNNNTISTNNNNNNTASSSANNNTSSSNNHNNNSSSNNNNNNNRGGGGAGRRGGAGRGAVGRGGNNNRGGGNNNRERN